MDFIVRETGEKCTVSELSANGRDYAQDTAFRYDFLQYCLEKGIVVRDEEKNAYIASWDMVQYWKRFFGAYQVLKDDLDRLRQEYDSNQVNGIFSLFLEDFDLESYQRAFKGTSLVLQRRYNTNTARLIGTHSSGLPTDNPHYYTVSLYRQKDGEYFMVGEGGPESQYGREGKDGGMLSGRRSFSVPEAEARKWMEKYGGKELVID